MLSSDVSLIDHHCHGIVRGTPSDDDVDALLSEGGVAPAGTTNFDTPLGLAVRRHCAPLLDLSIHAPVMDYLARRRELGGPEVARRMLRAADIATYVVDTGFHGEDLTEPAELAGTGAGAHTIVRLEAVADGLLARGVEPGEFRAAFAAALTEEVRRTAAVGLKSVAAYRTGFALDPARPDADELAAAVAGSGVRTADPVLSRELLWAGAELGLPVQLHVGLGDRDVRLHASDPALLTDLIEALPPVPLMLLHCWPYQRQAGYLAAVWPTVHLDVGLAMHFVGPGRAAHVLAEAMEVAPSGKLLYSSDAYGLPELYLLGADGFRRALGTVLDERVAGGEWSSADADRIARLIAQGNAARVYDLGTQ